MERLEIGGAVILLDDVGTDRDGRTIYGYSIRLDGVNPTHQSRDLKSGCNGGSEADGMESLLSFLTAAAESYRYHGGMMKNSNTDLFPEEICEWAAQHADELSMAELELSEPEVPDGYEVFHSKEYNSGPCNEGDLALEPGWYWWSCQPGCLPDGDPAGPFSTEKEAIRDCRDGLDG